MTKKIRCFYIPRVYNTLHIPQMLTETVTKSYWTGIILPQMLPEIISKSNQTAITLLLLYIFSKLVYIEVVQPGPFSFVKD